jgi:23S rRNA (uracil1939-C5)-methyltransferase
VSNCSHLPACPGCPRFGASTPAPDAITRLRELCELHAAPLDVKSGARLRYRLRARLAVRGRAGAPKIGIFSEGSHRVVDIPNCEIHHPLINQVARALKASMRELGATCYSDTAHAGLVRAVQIAVERSTGTAQVVLVCNATDPASARPLLDSLSKRLGPALHSLWWNGNPARTNVILGNTFEHVLGPEYITEMMGGARVFFPPAAFGQNNLDLFDEMVAQIHRAVPADARVVELYAGSGAIGLGLVSRAASLVFNELGEASLEGLSRGLAELSAEERSRVRVVRGSAETAASAITENSTVIVDPPRKGLEPLLIRALVERAPGQLIYVSCGLSSLLRDTEVLVSHGLRLTSATAYDLFPYTDHVETVAFFRRAMAPESAEL